jgi:XRE family aerobic/anaerobic benzoate catabolism transcriptional regulator
MTRADDDDSILGRVGRAVRGRREHAGLTIREIAARSGLSPRFVAMVEGGLGNISLTRLERLARALAASPAELLSGVEPAVPRRHVALLGLRGAGKTTLGARAAAASGRTLVELDRVVEDAAGMPLGEIFAVHGEPYYRKLEREALDRLLARPEPLLIATGGGIVAAPETFDLLRRSCTTVWLKAAPEDHWQRVVGQGDKRPMASRPDAMVELRAILAQRSPLYRTADHVLDTSRLTVDVAARRLAGILEGGSGVRAGAARRSSRSASRQREA